MLELESFSDSMRQPLTFWGYTPMQDDRSDFTLSRPLWRYVRTCSGPLGIQPHVGCTHSPIGVVGGALGRSMLELESFNDSMREPLKEPSIESPA